ncbi:MAG: hypothetical protein HY692_03400 [Cyanobacteria bacterium NC_groundwater_1444_Ag_S-0.65um_54_12]|nr:hypothetical protein [Cyanobacteria bacterium NC_groundwater_1444_Ag_S-0.65um_54_12]
MNQDQRSALVLLNPAARRGRGKYCYDKVHSVIAANYESQLVELDSRGDWKEAVHSALLAGVRVFIAAGGDGTVNSLATTLVTLRGVTPLAEITIGAVGIGSSNDFHKPVAARSNGLPIRINLARSSWRDIGRACYTDENGQLQERYFLVSASLGVTAAANGFFNHPDNWLSWLKRWWVQGAIVYAAIVTIARHQNLPAVLQIASETRPLELSNLSVMKTPYLSGSFRYDTPVEPDNGLLAVNLCSGMTRCGILQLLWHLACGRFTGLPGTWHWLAPKVTVELERSVDLELDGEVFLARSASFDILTEQLRVCG